MGNIICTDLTKEIINIILIPKKEKQDRHNLNFKTGNANKNY